MRSAILFAALAASAACGGGHAPKSTTPVAHDAMDAARRAVESWRQAWEADSYDAIAPLYAHDKSTVLVEQGHAFAGWDQADAHLKEVLGHAREIHVKLADVTIEELGDDAAVVVASMDRDVSDGQVTTTERGVLTLVLHRDADRWVVVSEHYSYPHST
jgi:uncharacterized protein (TIGR02246 family)